MYLNMCIPQSSLEVHLNAMEVSKSQALQIADAQKCTMREQLLDEMAGYKVVCLGVTCVSLSKHELNLQDWGNTMVGIHRTCMQ